MPNQSSSAREQDQEDDDTESRRDENAESLESVMILGVHVRKDSYFQTE